MGPWGAAKGNTQLTRQNHFFCHKSNYYIVYQGKQLSVTVGFRLFVCFFRKRYRTAKTYPRWVPWDPRNIYLATNFIRNMLESSDSMYSSIVMLENILYHNFNYRRQNSQESVTIVSIMGLRGPELNWNKILNLLRILSTSGKMMVSYVFQHKNGETQGIWAFWHFWSKIGR